MMMARNVIFIGGIHGVGKTQLCDEICAELNIEHINAGELIRRFKREEATTRKEVDNVQRNQEALISALQAYVEANTFYLLDGHFCLLKRDGFIERIPVGVFEQINPLAVVLLKDEVTAIKERLEQRDNATVDLTRLRDLQKLEIEHATNICETHSLPLLTRNPFITQERTEIMEFVRGRVST